MQLKPGTRLGAYEIQSPIGAGGMGEVYRARDTKLGRDVAIKLLPEVFARDADRLSRFEREAHVLASLNHPNIAHIYGFEQPEGRPFLVLELVDGPTLADRIARGPLPVTEAVAIAKQIADALETAHERGVIHRDLKPANIKLGGAWGPTPARSEDGRLEPRFSAADSDDYVVKVLDFGLAKALDPTSPDGTASAELANSPTLTARATEIGLILGTAAYMSPEQAKGKPVDRRADIWAFGVVLFEMITGRSLFDGETASEVMASVMKEEPEWARLPADLPEALRRLLRRCLEKDPKRRLSAISDARLELAEPPDAKKTPPSARAPRPALWIAGAALAGALVAAAALLWVVPAFRSAADAPLTRVTMLGPEGVTLVFDSSESAISPDGRSIVFTANDADGSSKLWLRPLDGLEAHPLAGTEHGELPFWSPDGRQIAFFADQKLKKMPAAGGTIEVLCEAKDSRGGAWGPQDVIVFAPSNAGPLHRVPGNGGESRAVTTVDSAHGETGHRFPSFLPDGRFVYAALPQRNLKFDLYVGSLDGSLRHLLMSADGAAVYADPEYLLFPRKNVLMAQRFDPRSLTLLGDAVAIGEAPAALGAKFNAGRAVSVSSTGTLAYSGDRLGNTKLEWFDRSGRPLGRLAVPDGSYQEVAVSPDGRRAAIVRYTSASDSDIWIADLERGGATRFTSGPALNFDVVWSPDGARLAFASDRKGPRDLFVKPATAATPEESLYSSAVLFKDTYSWSPDGKLVVFEQLDPQTSRDIWLLPIEGDRAPTPYLRTSFNEHGGQVSPDGRWMAYASDESGRYEIYVDAFPIPRSKYRVTDHGANAGFWRKDGRELATMSVDSLAGQQGGPIFVTGVTATSTEFHAGTPRQLFTLPRGTSAARPMPDFQRFLVTTPIAENTTSSLTLVLNWQSALKRR